MFIGKPLKEKTVLDWDAYWICEPRLSRQLFKKWEILVVWARLTLGIMSSFRKSLQARLANGNLTTLCVYRFRKLEIFLFCLPMPFMSSHKSLWPQPWILKNSPHISLLVPRWPLLLDNICSWANLWDCNRRLALVPWLKSTTILAQNAPLFPLNL